MKKNDTLLRRDVLDELDWEPSLDASAIGVAAKDGVVTLTGNVDSYGERLAAERAAKRVSGVEALANEIGVRLPSALVRDDTAIAEAALHALKWNVLVPEDRVRVIVSQGRVTLEGELDWMFQRDAAYRAVRELTGVTGVNDRITITPRVSAAAVSERIGAALERSAEVDARGITVEEEGGKITLRGAVSSWAERDDAARAAWSAPGVANVVNLLVVEVDAPALT